MQVCRPIIARAAAVVTAFGVCLSTPAQAVGFDDLLSDFDFETGRVMIIPPEGVRPEYHWSIGFVVDLGDRRARTSPIRIDWRDADATPAAKTQLPAFELRVDSLDSNLAEDAFTTFKSFAAMNSTNTKVSMQLSAGFRLDDAQAFNICDRNLPAPVDVWVKRREDAPWARLGDMESAMSLSHLVGAAIRASCPTEDKTKT